MRAEVVAMTKGKYMNGLHCFKEKGNQGNFSFFRGVQDVCRMGASAFTVCRMQLYKQKK